MSKRLSQRLASGISESFLLRSGKELHEKHANDWQLGGSFVRKLLANFYLILHDYGEGAFPPKLVSREGTFEEERKQFESWEFQDVQETVTKELNKPFSFPPHLLRVYSWALVRIVATLEQNGVHPGARLLELGCGMGWMSELLASRGYDVTGTTIAPIDIENANKRVEILKIKGVKSRLEFICTPMEEVDRRVDLSKPYDAVFCFEALHHAFDWRESLNAATRCLRPGGALFLFSEPPPLHTFICYRSSKILKTHEIGFKRKELVGHLQSLGFHQISVSRPVQIDRVRDFWKKFMPFDMGNGSLMARSFWLSARKGEPKASK